MALAAPLPPAPKARIRARLTLAGLWFGVHNVRRSLVHNLTIQNHGDGVGSELREKQCALEIESHEMLFFDAHGKLERLFETDGERRNSFDDLHAVDGDPDPRGQLIP